MPHSLQAKIRFRDPTFTDEQGQTYPGDMNDRPIVWQPLGDCRHKDTICLDCAEKWMEEYVGEVEVNDLGWIDIDRVLEARAAMVDIARVWRAIVNAMGGEWPRDLDT